eukprot:10411948-Prorocentrum_lima.AAC.1
MTSSLVGSEMCIRDREQSATLRPDQFISSFVGPKMAASAASVAMCRCPVSYTHLTLPTICSV